MIELAENDNDKLITTQDVDRLYQTGRSGMTREDWIILRLLMTTTKANLHSDLDVARSIMHLIKRYGQDAVNNCIDQLHKERNK